MRIISKQKDFYDHVSAFGIDKTVVYVRSPKQIKNDQEFEIRELQIPLASNRLYEQKPYVTVHTVYVLVCGRMDRFFYRSDYNGEPFISFDDMLNQEPKLRSKSDWFYRNWNENHPFDPNKDYSYLNDKYDANIIVFGIDFSSPVIDKGNQLSIVDGIIKDITFDSRSAVLDAPILGMLGLGSFVDPFEIWTAIEMRLSMKTTETVEVSDKTKVQKAGFDVKKSFRNMDRN